MHLSSERTIEQYAAAIASAAPTPGGGSVAATVGAFAAALAEMVANVTLSGKSSPADPAALQRVSTEGRRLRLRLLDLAVADEAAYDGYREASALPRSSEEEKRHRREALDRALIDSATAPLEIARSGVEVIDLLLTGAGQGTKHALSDISTGAVLVESAIRGALFTAGVNAELMRDPAEQANYVAEISSLSSSTTSGVAAVLDAVKRRSIPAVENAALRADRSDVRMASSLQRKTGH
jgi:formiminotetrahydrofolate cyclodeaminase